AHRLGPFQHVHFIATALHVFQTLVHVVFSATATVTMLLWWMDISQAQAREWVGWQGLAFEDELLKLKSAAVSLLEHVASTLHHKVILGKQGVEKDASAFSEQ
ncbi:unnamed protein product, partial [Closterium sp. NIES-53]